MRSPIRTWHRAKQRASIVLSIAMLVAIPSLARAQAAEYGRCLALYREGNNLFKSDPDTACKRFAEAFECNEQSPDAEYMLARCDRRAERYADAWTHFTRAAKKYETLTDDPALNAARAKARELCLQGAKEVEELRASLQLDIDPPPHSLRDLSVLLDGEPPPEGAKLDGFPINPGAHRIQIRAEGYEPFEANFDVLERVASRIVVRLKKVPQPIASDEDGAGTPPPPPPPPPPPVPDRGHTQRILGWSLAGVGTVSAIVATVFWVLTANDIEESNPHCTYDDGKGCDEPGVKLRNSARNKQTIAIVLTAGGGAAIASGLTVVFTAPSGSSHGTSAQLVWRGAL